LPYEYSVTAACLAPLGKMTLRLYQKRQVKYSLDLQYELIQEKGQLKHLWFYTDQL
jgi:hypothetical protein